MFKNKVGLFLSTVVSKISARQMDVGGAVKAYVRVKAVSEVQKDTLSRITYLQTECRKCVLHLHRDDVDGLVLTTDSLWGASSNTAGTGEQQRGGYRLTRNGALCLPAGTSPMLKQVAFAGKDFRSSNSPKVPSVSTSK
jgi:hypothetical protein